MTDKMRCLLIATFMRGTEYIKKDWNGQKGSRTEAWKRYNNALNMVERDFTKKVNKHSSEMDLEVRAKLMCSEVWNEDWSHVDELLNNEVPQKQWWRGLYVKMAMCTTLRVFLVQQLKDLERNLIKEISCDLPRERMIKMWNKTVDNILWTYVSGNLKRGRVESLRDTGLESQLTQYLSKYLLENSQYLPEILSTSQSSFVTVANFAHNSVTVDNEKEITEESDSDFDCIDIFGDIF